MLPLFLKAQVLTHNVRHLSTASSAPVSLWRLDVTTRLRRSRSMALSRDLFAAEEGLLGLRLAETMTLSFV